MGKRRKKKSAGKKSLAQPFETIASLNPMKPGTRDPRLKDLQRYLMRFGYLKVKRCRMGVLDKPTCDALAAYQGFHGLRRSAQFDPATRGVMTQARCAMPDVLPSITAAAADVSFATACAWGRLDLKYAFDVGTADIAGTAEFQAVRNAFATWASVVRLTFTERSPYPYAGCVSPQCQRSCGAPLTSRTNPPPGSTFGI